MPRRKFLTHPTLSPQALNIPVAILDNAVTDTLPDTERKRAFIRHSHLRHTYLQDLADQMGLTLTDLYEIAVDEFVLKYLNLLPPPRHLPRYARITPSQRLAKKFAALTHARVTLPKKPTPP